MQKGETIKNLIATDINNDDIIDIIVTFNDKDGNLKTNICMGYKDMDKDYTKFRKAEVLLNTEFVFGDFDGDRM